LAKAHELFLRGGVRSFRPYVTLTNDDRGTEVLDMIFTPGGGIAAASGSIGGMTFSRNRGGPYVRLRAVPVNPNTAWQQKVRSLVATLTSYWLNGLNEDQRAAWDTYASNVHLPNALGSDRNVGGLAMFVRSNVSRLQADPVQLPQVDDAPVIFNLGDYTLPTLGNASEAGQTGDVTFDNTDDWAGEGDAAMLVYGSRAQNPSINYFKGPYRYADLIPGDAVTPPTSPHSVTWPFPFVETQRLFLFGRVTRGDGRLSSPFRLETDAIA